VCGGHWGRRQARSNRVRVDNAVDRGLAIGCRLRLARASKVGVATIRRADVFDGEIPVTLANEAALRRALETAGIDFIEDTGEGKGYDFGSRKSAKNGYEASHRVLRL
jgi:hypothetical protein